MNLFHRSYESLYKRTVWEAKFRGIFVSFFRLAQFSFFVYVSSILVVENFQKYHWIQHKKTQPVLVTSEPIGIRIKFPRKNPFECR